MVKDKRQADATTSLTSLPSGGVVLPPLTQPSSVDISDEMIEAGARAFSEWRRSGGTEYLGDYCLAYRIFVSMAEASGLIQVPKH